jgi:hypothetical protein
VVPIVSVPGDGSWPPSTKFTPPSSEYMNPETEIGFELKPRKSLNPITMCCPVLSTAIEVSDCVDAGPASAGPSSSQSGSLTQTPVSSTSFPVSSPGRLVLIAARERVAERAIEDIRLPGCLELR